jgi:hypothetical protein
MQELGVRLVVGVFVGVTVDTEVGVLSSELQKLYSCQIA